MPYTTLFKYLDKFTGTFLTLPNMLNILRGWPKECSNEMPYYKDFVFTALLDRLLFELDLPVLNRIQSFTTIVSYTIQ